jgi:uncharacterized protein YndB with AHSA1/START domain
MKNFDWTKFTIKILVRSTIEEIYNAWTKSAELERWLVKKGTFFDTARHPVEPNVQAQKDFKYSWTRHLFDAVENGRYTAANGKDNIQFTFAGDCIVDVKLSVKYDWVQVELTMRDIPVDEISKEETRLRCHSQWSFYLINLKSVYEGGLDLRNKDTYFRRMVNN